MNNGNHYIPPVLNDLPTTNDGLDFGPYVKTLAELVTSSETHTPLTIGVFGTWGSGKTSLLQMVQEKAGALLPESVSIWFDAWKYDRHDALWRALLLRVLDALAEHIPDQQSDDRRELERLRESLYRTVEDEEVGSLQIDWGKVGAGAVQVGLKFLPGADFITELLWNPEDDPSGARASRKLLDAVRRERTKIHLEQVRFLEEFQRTFAYLIDKYVLSFEGASVEGRLLIFVDDLDRCLLDKAIEVLEAIKLFLDVPGCVFVLGLDRAVVARSIESKYRQVWDRERDMHDKQPISTSEGDRYLEKIIQVPFRIPQIENQTMKEYVTELVGNWPDDRCLDVFATALGRNPRRVKRTINVFFLLWRLANARRLDSIMPVRLAKLVVLQQEVHGLYDLLRENPSWVEHLESYVRRLAEREHAEREEGRGFNEESGEDQEDISMPSLLRPQQGILRRFAERPVVRRIFTLHDEEVEDVNFVGLERTELRLYFTLTQRTEPAEMRRPIRRDDFIEPEMRTILAGRFLMGSTSDEHRQGDVHEDEIPQHQLELPEYHIGKYPVTNAEYQRFVSATAHPSPVNWEGQQYPEERGDHPVTRVSWYDANAYCRWLREKTGRSYDLPSEAEWEKAARGSDGRKWPWGNDWDSKRANTREGGTGDTTAVGAHSPEGDSPYDVADMAGNVWEWTRSSFQKYRKEGAETAPDSNRRMLRGGSYLSSSEYVRCAVRNREDPHHWHRDCGFRLILPMP